MAYNLSSTGFIAFLMKENEKMEEKKGKYSHVTHGYNPSSGCRRHTFYYDQESIRYTLIANEEENQRDALEPNCCQLYRILEKEYCAFFKEDNQGDVKDDILRFCTRNNKGLGFGHCKFPDSDIYKNNKTKGVFWLTENKRDKKLCSNKNAS